MILGEKMKPKMNKFVLLFFLFAILLSSCASSTVERPDMIVNTDTGSIIILGLPRSEAEQILPSAVNPNYSPLTDGGYWTNIYGKDSKDRISIGYDYQEDKILLIEVQSNGDDNDVVWALPGGITMGADHDEIVAKYGTPTHDSKTQLAYYYDKNNQLLTDAESTSDTLNKCIWLELDDVGLSAFTVMAANAKTIP